MTGVPESSPGGGARQRPLRIVGFGTYDGRVHPRIRVLLEGLRAAGHEVTEVNVPLGLDTTWRVRILRQPWLAPVLALRVGWAWIRLVWKARSVTGIDAVVVGYLAHLDVHLARRRFRRSVLVLDHLVSLADTARDRGAAGAGRASLLERLDRAAVAHADVVVVDTAEHVELLPPTATGRAVVVPVGAPPEWFVAGQPRPAGPLRVVFFGLFTPLQGTPVIARAIARLARTGITFTMCGRGQDLDEARAVAAGGPVEWVDWVPPAHLPSLVAGHDVCLGIFGTGPKALRVVPNKVYQGAAAGCAIVTSDTPPQRAILGPAGLYVPAGDDEALAAVLARLAAEPGELERARAAARQQAELAFRPAHVVRPLDDRLMAGRAR